MYCNCNGGSGNGSVSVDSSELLFCCCTDVTPGWLQVVNEFVCYGSSIILFVETEWQKKHLLRESFMQNYVILHSQGGHRSLKVLEFFVLIFKA